MGADSLLGKIKHAHTELLRNSTGQNVMRPTQCSEGKKLANHAGEIEVRRLLGSSKGKETEHYRYLSAYDVPGIVMSDECVFCVYVHLCM